ncbi:type II toxin-antitoxin system VapC family toxin [Frankia sp. R82]|uniref:type II toxin-antitoxin system VapC family toxin n=1 Tax=Frankia sp. R82 TaxID=2950553 RepID=UPI0020441B03|nr:type II toxin-antitoxin system VapC family toxin [Frankia sp. R82]MCM3885218.1 type II toxin-antitoxin system VapC family toxin [Frankia sp. R82]
MIILDTNVISELMRAAPADSVVAWVTSRPGAAVATTSVSVAEVCYGIGRQPAGRRRELLLAAADEVFAAFQEKVLPFDAEAARHYADVVVEREQAGTPISGFDAQIAAICRSSSAILATRNTDDFTGLDLDLVNPWDAHEPT